MELAVDHARSYYDMTYLRLAMTLGCKCCVADQRVLGGAGTDVPPPTRSDAGTTLKAMTGRPY